MTPVRPNAQPHMPAPLVARAGDVPLEATWPTALRALLMLTDAAHPGDPLLARLSDEDLSLILASLVRLSGSEPTSAA